MTNSADRAYSRIKSMILSGERGSGARLPEDTIASELGLSRTPVRDALRRLQLDGLVVTTPNTGARVASWTQDELGEIAHMRVLLEGYAAELAARKITVGELDELARLCDQMECAAGFDGGRDLDVLSRSNLDFHRAIATAARNNRLFLSLEPTWHFSLVIRKFALFSAERIDRSISHHREIHEALAEHDAEWAGSIMRTHLHAARAVDASLLETME